MENIKIFEIGSEELYELLDTAKTNLMKKNSEYKKLQNEVSEIIEQYPNLNNIYDTNSTLELTKEECKMLQKMMELKLKINEYEEREFLIEGAVRTCLNLQEQGLIE